MMSIPKETERLDQLSFRTVAPQIGEGRTRARSAKWHLSSTFAFLCLRRTVGIAVLGIIYHPHIATHHHIEALKS